MNLFELHVHYRGALAIWEALRTLGFAADDIYVAHGRALLPVRPEKIIDNVLTVLLKAQGKEFAATIGVIDAPWERVTGQWTKICEAVNAGRVTDAELQRVMDEMMPPAVFVELVAALRRKGFVLPKTTEGNGCQQKN